MYYDDGYNPDEFVVKKAELPEGYARAYKLSNGDIFSLWNVSNHCYILEYEDQLMYEVVENGVDMFGQTNYKRTGKVFTPDEITKWISL